MMHIITGSARGVRLDTLPGEVTRPTAERTKEAVFSMLQFDLEGRRVLDLFAGSGQMALEALSRGAASAVLVDKSKEALAVIRRNAQKTKLDSKCQILQADAVSYLQRYNGAPFHLVFLDPPYAAGLLPEVLRLLAEKNILAPAATLVAECGDPRALFGGDAELEARYTVLKQKRYGAANVFFLTPVPKKEKRHALIPGSFDPMTLGHLDIVKRACEKYDRVTVAVMINESKSYAHTIEEREEMARLTVSELPHVEIVSDSGMLVDLFDRIGADVIVKGVRNGVDLAYEEKMAAYNLAQNPRAVTEYLQADEELCDLSSTRVRQMLEKGEPPIGLVAPAVLEYLIARGECVAK